MKRAPIGLAKRIIPTPVKPYVQAFLKLVTSFKYTLFRKTGKIDRIYDEQILTEFAAIQSENASDFADMVIDLFDPSSVVDIGCGPGEYIAELARRGVDVVGVDGSSSVLKLLKIEPDKFILHDLTKPLQLARRFDLCLCMEVAEHIETRHSSALIDTLCRSSKVVFFTAAPPGQGGHDHINEQSPEFWAELFQSHGFKLDPSLTAQARGYLEARELAAFWLTANAAVYRMQ